MQSAIRREKNLMILVKNNGIFKSLQGEGVLCGLPTLFIRTWQCNEKCSWCDQKETFNDPLNRVTVSDADLVRRIVEERCTEVCFTGGEPMLQSDSIRNITRELSDEYLFSVETNATIFDPIPFVSFWSLSPKLHNWPHEQLLRWLEHVYAYSIAHQVKVVCKDVAAVEDALSKMDMYKASLVVQPLWGESKVRDIVTCCIDNGIRYSVQIHKVLGIW